MRVRIRAWLCVAATLFVTACSAPADAGDDEPSSPPSATVSTTPSESPGRLPSLPDGGAPTTAPKSRGANAAPSGPKPIYDSSDVAANNYQSWLIYEMNSPGDYNRSFEEEAYPDGVYVCTQLRAGSSLTTIESTLTGTKGWSGTGSASIIKGALNALCPWSNQGYLTYFDRNVRSASTALANAIQWTDGVPPEYEIGYFGKNVCNYLQLNGSAYGLEAYLQSFRTDPQLKTSTVGTFVNRFGSGGSPEMDQLLRRATHHTVFAVCLGDHPKLNGYWTMA